METAAGNAVWLRYAQTDDVLGVATVQAYTWSTTYAALMPPHVIQHRIDRLEEQADLLRAQMESGVCYLRKREKRWSDSPAQARAPMRIIRRMERFIRCMCCGLFNKRALGKACFSLPVAAAREGIWKCDCPLVAGERTLLFTWSGASGSWDSGATGRTALS